MAPSTTTTTTNHPHFTVLLLLLLFILAPHLSHFTVLLLLLLFILASHLSEGLQQASCLESERLALIDIKSGVYDAEFRLASWRGHNCCYWTGIACADNHVVKLDLRCTIPYPDYAYFNGSVSPSLLHLTHLQYLDLSMNYFNGSSIPAFIASLTNLSYLNLSNTGFNGPIPHELGNLTSLLYLDLTSLSYSQYTLTVDNLSWLSRLRSLQHLDMSFVDLHNAANWLDIMNTIPSLSVMRLHNSSLPSIPTTLRHLNLTSLTTLDLSSNFLLSTIPSWLFDLSGLLSLNLGMNSFSGFIPLDVGNLSKLQILDLSSNNVSGEIPDSLGNLKNLLSFSLHGNSISGEIPPTLGNLSSLHNLDLSHNSLTGAIPESVGNLTSLRGLYLSNNSISGGIPQTMGQLNHLEELFLDFNNLIGHIPPTLGNLCNLTTLNAVDNSLGFSMSGFMESLSKCSPARLQYLYMGNNLLSGNLTDDIGGIQSLKVLDLSNNLLNGSVPASIGQLSALTQLRLNSNLFTGELNEAHFSNLASLTVLDLADNYLTVNVSEDWLPPFQANTISLSSCNLGPKFPSWLRNQNYLNFLDLPGAGISDAFPGWFWELCLKGIYLNVSRNQMKGELPRSIECFIFRSLDLSFNRFEGLIPPLGESIALIDLSYNNFSGPITAALADGVGYLWLLLLSNNKLNGSIPQSICEANHLEVVDLSNNELLGELPDCWGSSSSTLGVVDLSGNELSGGIPSSMGQLNQLKSLHLSNNHISGEIPPSLQNCTQLAIIDLGDNRLRGEIPTWIGTSFPSLKVLRLRSNEIHGVIPVQLSLLASLQVLDLGSNNLSGVLPPSLGNLTALRTTIQNMSTFISIGNAGSYYKESLSVQAKGSVLVYTKVLSLVTSIDVSSNRLTGEIPDELTKLHGMRFLNLSGNHLRGGIPNSIGELQNLESLDLSMNGLSGRIPSSISSLNFLSILNLSNNKFSGTIPFGGQLQTFPSSYFSNNVDLCGPPLPKKCLDGTPSEQGTDQGEQDDQGEQEDEDGSDTIWIYIGFAPGFVVGFWGIIGVTMIKMSTRIAYFQFIDRITKFCM